MCRLQSIFPLVMIPLALPLARAERTERVRQNAEEQKSLRTTLRDAAGYTSFRLLVLGFFVCGLFVFFVATHLPAYCEDELGAEAGAEIGSWSMSAIGAANVVGSYTMPFLASKWPHRKQHLLALLYAGRSIAMVRPSYQRISLPFDARQGSWLGMRRWCSSWSLPPSSPSCSSRSSPASYGWELYR